MTRIINLPLRALEFVFTVIVMGLIGHMIAQAFAGNPATINYSMFVVAFSMASLFYLIPASWSDSFIGHPMLMIVLDLLNSLFFLTAAIALAARLEVHSCSNHSYLNRNEITNGSLYHREQRCREGQASDAFMWFAWVCYTASLFMSILSGRSTTNLRPRPTIRRPGMAQV